MAYGFWFCSILVSTRFVEKLMLSFVKKKTTTKKTKKKKTKKTTTNKQTKKKKKKKKKKAHTQKNTKITKLLCQEPNFHFDFAACEFIKM